MDNGLMWERTPNNSHVNWTMAQTTCSNSTLAGYNDWRLASVNDYRKLTGGTLVCTGLPECGVTCPCDWDLPAGNPFQSVLLWYWTSSGPSDPIDPAWTGYAWYVGFYKGLIWPGTLVNTTFVWCVRN